MVIEIITDKGTATPTGRKKRNSGTASKESPKPRVDLTSEAIKLMARIKIIVKVILFYRSFSTLFSLDTFFI